MATLAPKAAPVAAPIPGHALALAGLALGGLSVYLSMSSKPKPAGGPCAPGQVVDPTTGLCVAPSNCPAGQTVNPTTGFCEQAICPQYTTGTPPNCVASQPTAPLGTTPGTCPPGYQYGVFGGVAQCVSESTSTAPCGYAEYRDINGVCQPDRPSGSAPVIGKVTPNQAPSGTRVTITGEGFGCTGLQVLFGSSAGLNVQVLSDTLLTVTVPQLPVPTQAYPVIINSDCGPCYNCGSAVIFVPYPS